MGSASPPLACSVRACGAPLTRLAGSYACPRGHAYDLARSGYLNLLQPQDRRSLAAGDTRAAVEARARLFAAGVWSELVAALVQRAAGRGALELGSGSGDVLAALGEGGIGIDLSTAAAEHAARRFPAQSWVVANADRRLPLLSASLERVLSVNGRRNPEECARVLRPGGRLVVSVPAADDLAELRAAVQGSWHAKDRVPGLRAEHEPWFEPLEQVRVAARRRLGRGALLDLLSGTYRGERASSAQRVAALGELEVTLAAEVVVFARK